MTAPLASWECGEARLTLLDAGRVWLDGGAMFGVVPKPLWSRLRRPDDRNRIELAMNLLLIEDGHRCTLVDTGAGTKWDAKATDIYGIETCSADELLAPAGLTPDRIDRVICSHLHFDHAGGNTVDDGAGGHAPAFPNATYVVQRRELETARLRNERIRASYMPENYEPLAALDRLEILDGDARIDARIAVEPAPGHTPGMQMVLVDGGGETVCFLADLVPTGSHVRYPYIMGYDLEPLVTLATKKNILPRAVSEGWTVVFEHDAELPIAVLEEREGRIVPRPRDN